MKKKLTNEQILKKCIEKAVKNGYLYKDWDKESFIQYLETRNWKDIIEENEHYKLILSHSFAKAFWGKRIIKKTEQIGYTHGVETPIMGIVKKSAWQYHLQQLVLTKDKFAYLKKFL